MALSIGEVVLDRYVVEACVGVGGMGEVYRAHHETLGIPVAIKVVSGESSSELVQRFHREALLLARVRHRNVVSILDVGKTQGGEPCMAMEFLEGEALDARLERRGALPVQEVRAIAASVLKGLDAIHGAGIIHRDLKPANVFATRGPPEVIKLVDFGIAYSTAKDAAKYTRTGAVIGTPAYMSPEQLVGGALDARSDLYALALVLYELVCGRLPFGDEPTGALRRLNERIPPPAAPKGQPPLSETFVNTLLGALAVDASQRPRSARAFYNLLKGSRRSGAAGASAELDDADAAEAPHAPSPRRAVPTAAVPAPPPARGQARAAPPVPASAPEPQAPPATAVFNPWTQGFSPQSAGQPPTRALVAAKLPVSRMSRDEQRALAELAAPGRAYHIASGVWFAVVPAADEQEARAHAHRLRAALQKRYGETCKCVWAPASPNFALTPAMLSGSAPLPEEIGRLLEHLV